VSLILDALNKSEQERTERDNAANIHAVHGSSPEQGKRLHHRRWFWEFMAVVLIVVLVYFYTEFTAKALVPAVLIESTQLPVETDSIAVVDRPVHKPVVEPVVTQEIKPPVVEPSSSDAVRQLYEQPEVIEAAPVIVEEEVVSPVVEPPVDENAQWIAVPLISELSPTISSGIASIDFSVHRYSDEEGASFVNLNGELQREGDLVAPGLRLVKIFEYGVILDYQGTQFRLLPLSGWVNM
jgi:hypothetical protein